MRTTKQRAQEAPSRKAIYAALLANGLIALTKFIAAFWTGSASMLSEGVHSLVDTGNELLLLYGLHRAQRSPDAARPLGYGRELYFWSFVVALLVFALGAGAALFQGVTHIVTPHPIEDAFVNYIVLAASFLFEGASWRVSLAEFRKQKGAAGYFETFQRSKDPTTFMVLFEDSAALIGIAIAALATYGAVRFAMPVLDGMGSILIGLVLAATAALLARESKSLLIGERADRKLADAILAIAGAESKVARANGVLTVQLAPDQVVAALSLDFADELRAADIEDRVVEIERKVRAAHPEVVALFVKPQADKTYAQAVRDRFGGA